MCETEGLCVGTLVRNVNCPAILLPMFTVTVYTGTYEYTKLMHIFKILAFFSFFCICAKLVRSNQLRSSHRGQMIIIIHIFIHLSVQYTCAALFKPPCH